MRLPIGQDHASDDRIKTGDVSDEKQRDGDAKPSVTWADRVAGRFASDADANADGSSALIRMNPVDN